MRILNLLAGLVCIAAATQGLAQENLSTTKSYALRPEGKTLPAGVARVRLPYLMATGSEAYDKNGNKSDAAVKVTATAGAVVAEYGVSDKISLQLKTDYILSQKVELNPNTAAYSDLKSKTYSEKTATLATATKLAITDQTSLATAIKTAFIGGCIASPGGTAQVCATNYESGALNSAGATALGLASSFGAGSASISAKAYATAAAAATESAISSGIKSKAESEGGRGMGDTIAGVLYEAYDTNSLFVALAGGIRLPTGNRDLAGTEQDTTRSAYELGLRFNIDALPMDWLMISWQNQSEVGFMGTKRKVSGVTEEHKRDGVRNVGFVYLKPSLEALNPALSAFRASVGLTYDYDSAEIMKKSGVETATQHSQMNWAYASLGYSLLNMQFPLEIDVEHEMPFQGKNVTLATKKTTITAKAYAKF